jgi:mono/diheme cytochrome c family protein
MSRRGLGVCAGTRGALAWAVPAVVSLAAAPAVRAADAAPAYPAGFSSFQANCAVCHGPAGAGLPALAPPLVSYPARYAASLEGRRQLALTVLYGMVGDITVDDKHYNFQMPDFARLDNATLAATLNFVVFDLGHASAEVKPLTAEEIAAERAQALDGTAVRAHRKSVAPGGP